MQALSDKGVWKLDGRATSAGISLRIEAMFWARYLGASKTPEWRRHETLPHRACGFLPGVVLGIEREDQDRLRTAPVGFSRSRGIALYAVGSFRSAAARG